MELKNKNSENSIRTYFDKKFLSSDAIMTSAESPELVREGDSKLSLRDRMLGYGEEASHLKRVVKTASYNSRMSVSK